MYYLFKILVSALAVVAISELAKRSSLFGALVAALPVTSLLAIIWLWAEGSEVQKIAQLSSSIFWLVIPSLLFFVLFPLFLNRGLHFWISFAAAAGCTITAYLLLSRMLSAAGIEL